MKFTKSDEPNRRVEKTAETGALYVSLWTDGNGREYVRIEDNVGGGPSNGSFSRDLFPLDDIGPGNEFKGFDISNGTTKITSDRNMPGFLRAIKRHLTEEREAKRKTSN